MRLRKNFILGVGNVFPTPEQKLRREIYIFNRFHEREQHSATTRLRGDQIFTRVTVLLAAIFPRSDAYSELSLTVATTAIDGGGESVRIRPTAKSANSRVAPSNSKLIELTFSLSRLSTRNRSRVKIDRGKNFVERGRRIGATLPARI